MPQADGWLDVEIAYALPETQQLIELKVAAGTTAREAIEDSGILQRFPEIDLSRHKVGIFGRAVRLDRVLGPGDRVEIYRPLLADPKDTRRRRAGKTGTGA
jgi:putative ubiquitin-RnfH superfamily antitoxin RatB of RatAB toxin-antitoxin module